jgi:hypothetical protein
MKKSPVIEQVQIHALRVENVRRHAQVLLAEISGSIADIENTLPSFALYQHDQMVGGRFGEREHPQTIKEMTAAMDDRAQALLRRLRRTGVVLDKFVTATRPTRPNAQMISGLIKDLTGFPAAHFLNVERNHHTVETLEHAVLITMIPAPVKGNRPQPTRPVAVAAAKAVRGLEEQGFRTVPGEEPYSFLVVMPPARVPTKELDRIERLVLAGLRAAGQPDRQGGR